MIHVVKAYLGALGAFLVLDGIWLGVLTRGYYREQIGHLMAEQVDYAAAAAFYLLYVAGIVALAVAPRLDAGSTRDVALAGAVLGLVAYGTYDLTNQAVMRDWPVAMTLIDMAWGALITSAAATGGFLVARPRR